MLTVQDILDAYAKTGLKPSYQYRIYDSNNKKIVAGCVLTALYVNDTGDMVVNNAWDTVPTWAEEKYGIEESGELEAGFCGWKPNEDKSKQEWFKAGQKASQLLLVCKENQQV